MVISKIKKWRTDRKRFPVRWLTYKQRVREDIERLYKAENGPEFFDDKYVAQLGGVAKQLEEWEIKLLTVQIAISVFIVIGFLAGDASMSLFGISLKQAPGVKEMLLALAATLAVVIYAVSQSKNLRLVVIEKLIELRENPRFLSFAKLAAPSAFHLNAYIARQSERWVFSTFLGKLIFVALVVLFSFFLLLLLGSSVALWIYLFVEIWRQPTLGVWSYIALIYAGIGYSVCLLWLLRGFFPLPFRDMEVLQELSRLEHSNPQEYLRRLNELYGDGS